tara:strand:+ start:284 stop:574 length:291 start_codon:yes stop_codon:yes gene_type:complete
MAIYSRSKKNNLLDQLQVYFTKKGKILTPIEFRDANDAGFINPTIIRQAFGNWGKMQNALKLRYPNGISIPKEKPAVKAKPALKAKPAPKAEKKAK